MGIQEDIVDVLKSKKEDITTTEIAKELKIDRHTAAKHLDVMHTKGIVDCRNIGKSNVWKLSESAFIKMLQRNDTVSKNLKQILGSMDEQVSIQNSDFNIMWTNKGNIKNHKCHEEYAKTNQKCKNCPVQKTFITGKSSSAIMQWPSGKTRITTQPIKNEYNDTVAVVEIVKKIRK